MSLTYTQNHNWWVQRVNKELMSSARFNMYNTRSTFYGGRKGLGFLNSRSQIRPASSKSLVSASQKSIKVELPKEEDRPESKQFSIRSGKTRPPSGGKTGYGEKEVEKESLKSGPDEGNEENLKEYIKELERMLRDEKMRRINTQEKLNRVKGGWRSP